jgi:hypothetical protein
MFGIKRCSKVLALVAVMALAATALIAPGVAPAQKAGAPFKIVANLGMKGTTISGKGTMTIGKGKSVSVTASGTVAPPKMTAVFKAPGGSVTVLGNNGKIRNGEFSGTFKLKGSGKYKNISGGGKINAPVTTLVFTFKGTASF